MQSNTAAAQLLQAHRTIRRLENEVRRNRSQTSQLRGGEAERSLMVEAAREKARAIQQEAHVRDQHFQRYIEKMERDLKKGKGKMAIESDSGSESEDEESCHGGVGGDESGEDVNMEEITEAVSDVSLRSTWLYRGFLSPTLDLCRGSRRRHAGSGHTFQSGQGKILYTCSPSPENFCRKTIDHTSAGKILKHASLTTHLSASCTSSRSPSPKTPSLIRAHEVPVSSRSRNLWSRARLHHISDDPLLVALKRTLIPQHHRRLTRVPPLIAPILMLLHLQLHRVRIFLLPSLATTRLSETGFSRC